MAIFDANILKISKEQLDSPETKVWVVVVQDTHVLALMFAAARVVGWIG
jgi:hypothetical protein